MIAQTPAFDTLVERLRAERIDLLIIDPLAKVHSAEENSNDDMKQVGRILSRLAADGNCAIGLVNHTPKIRDIAGDPLAGRGAIAMLAETKLSFTLAAMSETDAKALGVDEVERHRYVRFDFAKSNVSKPTRAIWFQRDEVGARRRQVGSIIPQKRLPANHGGDGSL